MAHPRCKREFMDGPARNRGGLFAIPDALLSSQGHYFFYCLALIISYLM